MKYTSFILAALISTSAFAQESIPIANTNIYQKVQTGAEAPAPVEAAKPVKKKHKKSAKKAAAKPVVAKKAAPKKVKAAAPEVAPTPAAPATEEAK